MNTLPIDIIERIACKLSTRQRCLLASVSKDWWTFFKNHPTMHSRVTVRITSLHSLRSLAAWIHGRRNIRHIDIRVHRDVSNQCVTILQLILAACGRTLRQCCIHSQGRWVEFECMPFLSDTLRVMEVTSQTFFADTPLNMRSLRYLKLRVASSLYIRFGSCPLLEYVDFSNCELPALPSTLKNLPQLRTLILDHNAPLARDADTYVFPRLSTLQHLSLRRCNLHFVPNMSHCSSLTFLDLSYNLLSEGFSHLGSLPSLRCLDVSSNAIVSLHDFDDVTAEYINLSRNALLTDDWERCSMRHVRHLVVSFPSPPRHIINRACPNLERLDIDGDCGMPRWWWWNHTFNF